MNRPDELRRTALTTAALAAAVTAIWAVGGAFAVARGQDAQCKIGEVCQTFPGYHFELYVRSKGPDAAIFRPKTVKGPFRDIAVCYVVGAIEIDALEALDPDNDFMGRCDGGILLNGREIANRALSLLPKN